MVRYSQEAGFARPVAPHELRYFLLTWLKKQGIDDALIQPYSGHASRQSLEIYTRLSMSDAQREYNEVIKRFLSDPGSFQTCKWQTSPVTLHFIAVMLGLSLGG